MFYKSQNWLYCVCIEYFEFLIEQTTVLATTEACASQGHSAPLGWRGTRLFGEAPRFFAGEYSRWGSSLFSRFLEYFWYIFSILSVHYFAFRYILVYLHAVTLFPLNGISVLVCLLILYVFLYFLYFYVFLWNYVFALTCLNVYFWISIPWLCILWFILWMLCVYHYSS